MMMMTQVKWFFIPLMAIGLFYSCSSDIITEQQHDFAEQKWMRFEADTFYVNIKNADDSYNIYFNCRYSKDLSIDEIPVITKIYDSEGTVRNFLFKVKIKSKDNNHLGDKTGEYYQNISKIKDHFFFSNPDEYKIVFQQVTSHYEISDVLGIGFKIEKAKLNYNFDK